MSLRLHHLVIQHFFGLINNIGLISLMGGKWTIYRSMGEETIDSILNYFKGTITHLRVYLKIIEITFRK